MGSKKITGDGLNLKQDLFCKYYGKGNETFGNGVLSYALAYKFNYEAIKSLKDFKTDSDILREYNVCKINSSKLLTKSNIVKKIQKYRLELMNDDFVDSELVKVVQQDNDLNPKLGAIREYNKLKTRITEKLDLTTQGKPITSILSSVKK